MPANNETSGSFKSSHEPAVVVHPAKVAPLTGPYGLAGDFAAHLPSSILSPQAQGFYYRGLFVIHVDICCCLSVILKGNSIKPSLSHDESLL